MPTGIAVSDIETAARDFAQDSSSSNPAVAQAVVIRLINDVYHRLWTMMGRRTITAGGVTIFPASAAGDKVLASTLTNVYEFLHLHREAAASTTILVGPEIERLPVHRITALQAEDATQGAPTLYSLERTYTTTVASQGKWSLRTWPLPDVAYRWSAEYIQDPQILTTTSQSPDVTEEECYILARIVASEMARLKGETGEFIDRILQPVPERMMQQYNRGPEVTPRMRPQSVPD